MIKDLMKHLKIYRLQRSKAVFFARGFQKLSRKIKMSKRHHLLLYDMILTVSWIKVSTLIVQKTSHNTHMIQQHIDIECRSFIEYIKDYFDKKFKAQFFFMKILTRTALFLLKT
jgi:hypothetical protein